MFTELNIPEEILGSFRRIQRSLPEYLKNDTEFLEKILVYLKTWRGQIRQTTH